MDDTTIIEFSDRDGVKDPLSEFLRKGARELLLVAVEAERDAFLAEFAERRTVDGRAAVVGSGYHPERAVQTGIGPITVKVPKVRAKDGHPVALRSALVPPYVRKAKSIEAALPWLYLTGISTGEMDAALKVLLGPEATGFSAKTISRQKGQWAAEYENWRKVDLSRDEWVYIWADGIYGGLRGSDDRLCVLVVIGVNTRGEKHFLAIKDGVREGTQSWREVLLSLKGRGLAAPRLATGEVAMGFWVALEEVFPATRQQRCWMHKTGNVLNSLPKRTQPKAKKMPHDIWQAESTRTHMPPLICSSDIRGQVPQGHTMSDKGSRGTTDFLRLPSPTLAKHPDVKSNRKHLRHDPTSDKAHQRMPQPGRHAPHDVQAGSVR